jgi:hypothetical protein
MRDKVVKGYLNGICNYKKLSYILIEPAQFTHIADGSGFSNVTVMRAGGCRWDQIPFIIN